MSTGWLLPPLRSRQRSLHSCRLRWTLRCPAASPRPCRLVAVCLGPVHRANLRWDLLGFRVRWAALACMVPPPACVRTGAQDPWRRRRRPVRLWRRCHRQSIHVDGIVVPFAQRAGLDSWRSYDSAMGSPSCRILFRRHSELPAASVHSVARLFAGTPLSLPPGARAAPQFAPAPRSPRGPRNLLCAGQDLALRCRACFPALHPPCRRRLLSRLGARRPQLCGAGCVCSALLTDSLQSPCAL